MSNGHQLPLKILEEIEDPLHQDLNYRRGKKKKRGKRDKSSGPAALTSTCQRAKFEELLRKKQQ